MRPRALSTPPSLPAPRRLTALWCALLTLAVADPSSANSTNERRTNEESRRSGHPGMPNARQRVEAVTYWPLATGESVDAEAQFAVAGLRSLLHVVFTDRGRLLLGNTQSADARLHWIALDQPRSGSALAPQALTACGARQGSEEPELYAISSELRLLKRRVAPAAEWQDLGEAPDATRLVCSRQWLIAQAADGRRWMRPHAPHETWLHAEGLPLASRDELTLMAPNLLSTPDRVREGLEAIATGCARPTALARSELTVEIEVAGSSIAVLEVVTANSTRRTTDPAGLRSFTACLEQRFQAAVVRSPTLFRKSMELTLKPLLTSPEKIRLPVGGRSVSIIKLNTNHADDFRILSATSNLQQLSVTVANAGREARLYVSSPEGGAGLEGTITLHTNLPGLPVAQIAVEQVAATDDWERWSPLLAKGGHTTSAINSQRW